MFPTRKSKSSLGANGLKWHETLLGCLFELPTTAFWCHLQGSCLLTSLQACHKPLNLQMKENKRGWTTCTCMSIRAEVVPGTCDVINNYTRALYIQFKQHQAKFPDHEDHHRVSDYSKGNFWEEIVIFWNMTHRHCLPTGNHLLPLRVSLRPPISQLW